MMNARRVWIITIFGTMIVSALAADEKRDAKEKLKGVWTTEMVKYAGAAIPGARVSHELQFEKDKLVFRSVLDKDGRRFGRDGDEVARLVIDDTLQPATIDIIKDVGGKTITERAIYKFEDGRLLVCHLVNAEGRPSTERPTTFESSSKVRAILVILKPKP